MIRIKEKAECLPGGTAVTIGKFDGVHIGHRRLFDAVLAEKKNGCLACVLSFRAKPEEGKNVIYTREEQQLLCESLGIDVLAEYTLDEALRSLSAEQFVAEVLCKELKAKVIVTGEDFRFGKDRMGDTALLRSLGSRYGYRTVSIPKVENGGMRISSTKIRELLSAGRMEEANALLGQPYFVYAGGMHGQQSGRVPDVPVIHMLPPAEKLLPAHGVYHTQTRLGGVWYAGITYVGVRTAAFPGQVSVETYLAGYDGTPCGRMLETRFLKYLHPEQKFDGTEAFTQAIQKEIKKLF